MDLFSNLLDSLFPMGNSNRVSHMIQLLLQISELGSCMLEFDDSLLTNIQLFGLDFVDFGLQVFDLLLKDLQHFLAFLG